MGFVDAPADGGCSGVRGTEQKGILGARLADSLGGGGNYSRWGGATGKMMWAASRRLLVQGFLPPPHRLIPPVLCLAPYAAMA